MKSTSLRYRIAFWRRETIFVCVQKPYIECHIHIPTITYQFYQLMPKHGPLKINTLFISNIHKKDKSSTSICLDFYEKNFRK